MAYANSLTPREKVTKLQQTPVNRDEAKFILHVHTMLSGGYSLWTREREFLDHIYSLYYPEKSDA